MPGNLAMEVPMFEIALFLCGVVVGAVVTIVASVFFSLPLED